MSTSATKNYRTKKRNMDSKGHFTIVIEKHSLLQSTPSTSSSLSAWKLKFQPPWVIFQKMKTIKRIFILQSTKAPDKVLLHQFRQDSMLNKLDSKKQSLTKDHPAQQTDDGRVKIDERWPYVRVFIWTWLRMRRRLCKGCVWYFSVDRLIVGLIFIGAPHTTCFTYAC